VRRKRHPRLGGDQIQATNGPAPPIGQKWSKREESGNLWTFVAAALHLDLAAKNRAPLLVLGDRHPALDTDPNTLFWWLGQTQQSFEK
jgi:hypothetical protein